VKFYIINSKLGVQMKKTLREQLLSRRKALAHAEVLAKSMKIKHRLFASPWYRDACTILFYVSYNNEVSTHEMIQESLINGKNVIVPKINTQNKALIISRLLCWDDLCPGVYSILEPKNDCVREVPVSSIDLCIIPGVVFDCKGNRIGHGGGYYDRLLQTKCHAHRIGLAFELQIVKSIPVERHDVKVETIITEERVIDCS
jgi:5-formyltetrahydrofolate cyclo-ligase